MADPRIPPEIPPESSLPHTPRRASPRPGVATAERGVVLLDGPQGVVAALTPEAAAATGENLRRAASLAARQRDEEAPIPLPKPPAPRD